MNSKKMDQILLDRPGVKKIREERKIAYQVADMIIEAREKRDITQSELAARIDTKQPSIARIESGENLPSLTFLKRIADALDAELIPPKFGLTSQEIGITYRDENVSPENEKVIVITHYLPSNLYPAFYSSANNSEIKYGSKISQAQISNKY